MRPGARRQAFVPVRGPTCGMADPSQRVRLFGLYWQLSVWSEIAAVAVFVWEPSHSRRNNDRAHSGPRLFRDRRSVSVTGWCLAGLSDHAAELGDDLGDRGFGVQILLHIPYRRSSRVGALPTSKQ
jgi:hypothetical protein